MLCRLAADVKPTPEAAGLPPPSNGAISPQDQADALHFVVAADREAYWRAYASVPGAAGPGNAWPAPCAMIRRAAEMIQSRGAEFSYALRSLHPGDPRNAPQTELEQSGLESIARNPGKPYYGREMLGGRRYFTAVYPDLPATAACLECHQRASPLSASALRLGEPLGGVVVRVPLEF